jgi:hypothetical protein
MKLLTAEHLTRYYISFEGYEYIRLVNKNIQDESITWMVIEEDDVTIIPSDEYNDLEEIFLSILE